MSVNTTVNRLILPPLRVGLYQQLFGATVSFKELGNRLIEYVEYAHTFRRVDQVREVSEILANHPLREFKLVGQYYLGWCEYRSGQIQSAQRLFELVADESRSRYRANAILSLAAVEARKGDFTSEARYYLETLKASESIKTSIEALRGIAIIKAKEGYHPQAVKSLESLYPLMRYVEPHTYFDYLNSLAVELGEAGRKYEARNIIKHVIASPIAIAYPEWQDTANELREAGRSFVAVPQIVPKPVETPKPVIKPQRPASVLPFPKLKEAPLPQKPERVSHHEAEDMDLAEMRETVMAAIRSGMILEGEYRKMMYMLGLVKRGPADKVIDLEDEALLADIIIEWCNMIDPEQFTAVISALRDCKDDYRRDVIMDSMISLAFQQTRDCIDSEAEWRRRVERRLPKK